MLQRCLDYILSRSAAQWKEMASKPALKFVLRLFGGFATNHAPSQQAVAEAINVIHQLEQISSDEHVGSLAENALEALRSHEKVSFGENSGRKK